MVLNSHNNKKVCKGRFLVLKKTKKRPLYFLISIRKTVVFLILI